MDAHQELTTNCLSCHTLFQGTPVNKCISCHRVDDIGLMTSKGVPIKREKKDTVAFHQNLNEADCISCHAEHQGFKSVKPVTRFSHELLNSSIKTNCTACHKSPEDSLHAHVPQNCTECHNLEKWVPARFEHSVLDSVTLKDCVACHPSPKDNFHQQVEGSCGQCHSQDKWVPSTFDHRKYFVFDKHHPKDCNNCHLKSNYQQYSCYECHEHSPSKIRSEHIEEGIYKYENCVECHRSGNEKDIRWNRGTNRKWEKDHDDD
ncbi:MAG: class III cytochrome C family protein [SAR324 cluster bacterium]|nr:class III cytochrome C family protein [SAR324 cluster bacterium]